MSTDPFTTLGLAADATAEEVRAARRTLAKDLHPDRGGDATAMQRVNTAAAEALRAIREAASGVPQSAPEPEVAPEWAGVGYDVPSFTVEALPVDTFHALLVVAGAGLGTVTDEDPPYRLDVEMAGPSRTWCRLEIVPDAGASTVSLAASAEQGHPLSIEGIRDRWVDALNRLDWRRIVG